MLYSVYVVENTANDMRYVGSCLDKNVETRTNHHLAGNSQNPDIKIDIAKFGRDVFEYHIIHKGLFKRDALRIEEQTIKRLDCVHPNGYNRTTTGTSLGKCKETCSKISESLMGHSVTTETRQKLSKASSGEKNPNYGKHPSVETRKKIGDPQRGEKNHRYGKRPHNALDDITISRIRQLRKQGMRCVDIAENVGVSFWTVVKYSKDLGKRR